MMNTRLILTVSLMLLHFSIFSQKFLVEKGSISFLSKAAVEDIQSDNKKVSSIFNTSSGLVAFSVPIKEFKFDKQLMQQHFNDKYLESDKFPFSSFAGKITGYALDKPGPQNVRAVGKLTIHGIVKDIDVPGTIEFTPGHANIKSTFKIKIADYGVKIPQLLWQNIAEQVDVIVNLTFKQQ